MPALAALIAQHKEAILARWLDLVLASYPAEAAALWKIKKSPISNPVGTRIKEGIRGILDTLVSDPAPEEKQRAADFIDDIVRVRAVQDFRPSEAVAYIYLLKKVIREDFWPQVSTPELFAELLALESKIDALGLLSLDIYVKCREKLFELRINEIKNVQRRLLERANLICGFSESDPPAEDKEGAPS